MHSVKTLMGRAHITRTFLLIKKRICHAKYHLIPAAINSLIYYTSLSPRLLKNRTIYTYVWETVVPSRSTFQ